MPDLVSCCRAQVSLGDMREAVLAIYKERKNLALTLQDAHTVIAKLELIFGSVLHVLAFFIYLVIFQVGRHSKCNWHACGVPGHKRYSTRPNCRRMLADDMSPK